MSLSITSQVFPITRDFEAAKAAILATSLVSAMFGCLILSRI
jgi:hypothetical protein